VWISDEVQSSQIGISSRLQSEAFSLRCTKFVWLKDTTKPALENNFQVKRFTRVPLGMISSPFLLAATVKYHLNEADAPVAKKIENNMYVHNMIRGVATEEQEDEFYHEAKPHF